MFARLRRDIREMFAELREYNELLVMMTRRDLMLRYRQTVMGFAWAVFMPVINTVVFTLIFRKVAKIETDVPYPVFSYCGLLPWNMFATSLKTGVNSLFSNRGLLTKVYFPREVFPFSTMLVGVVDISVGLSILAALMIYYGIPLSSTALFLPVLLAVQVMFTAGLCMFLAPGQSLLPRRQVPLRSRHHCLDVRDPVIYPSRDVAGPLGVILRLNPHDADHRRLPRASSSRRMPPSPIPFASAAGLSVVLFAAGMVVFHRAEYPFAENA